MRNDERPRLLLAALAVDLVAVVIAIGAGVVFRSEIRQAFAWTNAKCGGWSPLVLVPLLVVLVLGMTLAARSQPAGGPYSLRGTTVIWITAVLVAAAVLVGVILLLGAFSCDA